MFTILLQGLVVCGLAFSLGLVVVMVRRIALLRFERTYRAGYSHGWEDSELNEPVDPVWSAIRDKLCVKASTPCSCACCEYVRKSSIADLWC